MYVYFLTNLIVQLSRSITLSTESFNDVGEKKKEKKEEEKEKNNSNTPPSLFPISYFPISYYEQIFQILFLLFMYFIAIAKIVS